VRWRVYAATAQSEGHLESFAATEDRCAFDDRLQLSHIPGPRVFLKPLDVISRGHQVVVSQAPAGPFGEVVSESRQVFEPFAKGW
jgi:hypothetical protein